MSKLAHSPGCADATGTTVRKSAWALPEQGSVSGLLELKLAVKDFLAACVPACVCASCKCESMCVCVRKRACLADLVKEGLGGARCNL